MKGKLIVIDGSDSSGKNTQVKFLKEKLSKKRKVISLDFPRYGSFFGELVSEYLNGKFGKISEIDPRIPSLFFALDRFDEKERINSWLKKGYYVILDRYVESNLAYQSAKFKDKKKAMKFSEWIIELEYKRLGLPKPDLVIFLHMPIKETRRLLKNRPDKGYINDKRADIHEKDVKYLEKVESAYITLSKRFGWEIVECCTDKILSIDEISQKIEKVVLDKHFFRK